MSSNSAPPTTLPQNRERLLLLTLAGVQFTHILDFMIMMPLGPQLMQRFGIDAGQFGLLVSAYTFAAGASGLAASLYVDRFGRKQLLLLLYALFALATLGCALAPSFATLMLARVAAGVFGGVLSGLSQTIVADVVPFERRGRAMGVVMSSFSLATVAGLPLGLWLASYWNWHAPFYLIAGMSAILWMFAWKSMPHLRAHLALQQHGAWRNFANVLGQKNNRIALAFSLMLAATGFVVIPYITIYTTHNGGLSQQQISFIYLFGGLATLITQPWIGRLTDRLGKLKVFQITALLTALPLIAVTQSAPWGWWAMLTSSVLLFVAMSARMIPGMAIVSSACQPAQRGTYMAINSAVQSAGMGIAAFIGGHMIGQNSSGLVEGYGFNALLSVLFIACSLWLVGRVQLHTGFIGADHPASPDSNSSPNK